jgi:hypothetical protein
MSELVTRDEENGPLVRRAQGEFLEMPGLNLTLRQAARLWALDLATAERTLGALVGAGFLTKCADRYLRATSA